MTKIKRKKIDSTIESRILTGLIVSKEFIAEIYSAIDLGYFEHSYIQQVAKWVLEYYDKYHDAPAENMKDIYLERQVALKDGEHELVEALLTTISDSYSQSSGINVDYLAKQARKYFKKRELLLTANNLKYYLEKEDLDNAEETILTYNRISSNFTEWINPFDDAIVQRVFEKLDSSFFRFPGKLGTFLQDFERGWLVGISAPFKRGKTWFAQEFGIIGILSGLRVAFFSLEMTKQKMVERILKRLTGTLGEGGEFLYPVFDCVLNQTGDCDSPRKASVVPLYIDENETVAKYDDNPDYIPCTFCRLKEKFKDRFQAAAWWAKINRRPFDLKTVGGDVDTLRKYYSNLFRVRIYPRYSANVGDLKTDLLQLEVSENFIPDIIIVDYADILKPEGDSDDYGVNKEDRTWIALSQLAGEKNCLTIAPTQVSKEALDAYRVGQKHTARWVGKLGHVDAMMTLNQTDDEKKQGIMRVGWMLHRHIDFNENDTVTILQDVKAGQIHLDS